MCSFDEGGDRRNKVFWFLKIGMDISETGRVEKVPRGQGECSQQKESCVLGFLHLAQAT